MKDSQTFRPEIQGLRAIAVLAVLAFHLWPGALPGGYVGVDVFFVISGYLITGLLLKEYESTGTISVARFYKRRIRRLLPAATLVLIVVTTCIALLPASRWEDVASDIAPTTPAQQVLQVLLGCGGVGLLVREGADLINSTTGSLAELARGALERCDARRRRRCRDRLPRA